MKNSLQRLNAQAFSQKGIDVLRLLLDTHAFLWCLGNTAELSALARTAIADRDNDVFVSAVSGWEIAVKRAKGHLTAPDNLAAMVEERGFAHLPLTFHHAEEAGLLPMHHKDPFDRFLIAQAQAERLTLITKDENIGRYDVATMWA